VLARMQKAWSVDPDDSRSALAPQNVANETADDE